MVKPGPNAARAAAGLPPAAELAAPPEWSEWPPPMASRSDRRACARQNHHGIIKAGYCALCGTKVA